MLHVVQLRGFRGAQEHNHIVNIHKQNEQQQQQQRQHDK